VVTDSQSSIFASFMSYEPSFSNRPGGAAARPRFFSLLGLGSDNSESGPPSLKVIIDEDGNAPSSRDADSAVSLLRALDSAGDDGVARSAAFPPKPHTPTKKQAVSPVAQKFGRRAVLDSKPKGKYCLQLHHFKYCLQVHHFLSLYLRFFIQYCSAFTIQIKSIVQIKSIERITRKHLVEPPRPSISSKKSFSYPQNISAKASISAACFQNPSNH
jgi:hypothetical protein